MSVLAIDLGTSAVKALVWDRHRGVVARAQAAVPTMFPQPGWAEQDAASWWSAVKLALADLPLDGLTGVGLASQRETFVCLDENHRPLRPALLWSDGRGATAAARVRWLREHEPDVMDRTRWLAAPKDVVLHHLIGRLVTDRTLASRTDVDRALLPDVVDSREVVGEFRGAPVVAGAGDRACEAVAVGATSTVAMVSWGTTANCSLPRDGEVPAGWVASIGVDGGQLLEAGVSAAGAALGWLSDITGQPTETLADSAFRAGPGAGGVIALPWFGGARAPWWRADAPATFLGITTSTTPGHLARAIYEGVAHDIRRALERLSPAVVELRLAGGGSDDRAWLSALHTITALPYSVGTGDEAALGAVGIACSASGRPGPEFTPTVTLAAVRTERGVALRSELIRRHDAGAAMVLGSTT